MLNSNNLHKIPREHVIASFFPGMGMPIASSRPIRSLEDFIAETTSNGSRCNINTRPIHPRSVSDDFVPAHFKRRSREDIEEMIQIVGDALLGHAAGAAGEVLYMPYTSTIDWNGEAAHDESYFLFRDGVEFNRKLSHEGHYTRMGERLHALANAQGKVVTTISLGGGSEEAVREKDIPAIRDINPHRHISIDKVAEFAYKGAFLVQQEFEAQKLILAPEKKWNLTQSFARVANYSKDNYGLPTDSVYALLCYGNTVGNKPGFAKDGLPFKACKDEFTHIANQLNPGDEMVFDTDRTTDERLLMDAYRAIEKLFKHLIKSFKEEGGSVSFDFNDWRYSPHWDKETRLMAIRYIAKNPGVLCALNEKRSFVPGDDIRLVNSYRYQQEFTESFIKATPWKMRYTESYYPRPGIDMAMQFIHIPLLHKNAHKTSARKAPGVHVNVIK